MYPLVWPGNLFKKKYFPPNTVSISKGTFCKDVSYSGSKYKLSFGKVSLR